MGYFERFVKKGCRGKMKKFGTENYTITRTKEGSKTVQVFYHDSRQLKCLFPPSMKNNKQVENEVKRIMRWARHLIFEYMDYGFVLLSGHDTDYRICFEFTENCSDKNKAIILRNFGLVTEHLIKVREVMINGK